MFFHLKGKKKHLRTAEGQNGKKTEGNKFNNSLFYSITKDSVNCINVMNLYVSMQTHVKMNV